MRVFPFHYCKLCGWLNGKIICTSCLNNLEGGKVQDEITINPNIDTLYYGFDYVAPLSKMLICYKYRKQLHLQWALGYLLNRIMEQILLNDIDYIIPMPIHSKRKKERGYDHILLLLDYCIATNDRIGIRTDVVVKTFYHAPQMSLMAKERTSNLSGSFKVIKSVTNKNILIIDDVYTTGATVGEISRVLKEAGAKNIYACVLLRNL